MGDGVRSRIELSGSVGGLATELTQGQAESALWQQNVTAETSPEDRADRNQVRLRAEFWSERFLTQRRQGNAKKGKYTERLYWLRRKNKPLKGEPHRCCRRETEPAGFREEQSARRLRKPEGAA